ncbi:8-oxo-dGTP diphosphatase MutT [Gorillibacterium sp. CAU 1737]|uniref:8-oxo-dGTP diphosphatase MutT n=1 Tax=Gorillibacterium sp. CAU 1737 TaxID=3140362 RepID=UPI003261BC54
MIEVAAAIICNERNQVLIARRAPGKSQAGFWEFPGGKLEPGESPQDCLIRELKEEMGIVIEPLACFGTHEHDYGTFSIRLIAWVARYREGSVALIDHDEWCWAERSELRNYTFAPADVPFVERLATEADEPGQPAGHSAEPAEPTGPPEPTED